jgi:hypothetical protein
LAFDFSQHLAIHPTQRFTCLTAKAAWGVL